MLFFISKHRTNDLLAVLRSAAFAPYAGKIEERSCTSVKMLDFEIYKSTKFFTSGRFDYKPVLKSSARFLNCDSDHPVGVHLAWPPAYIHRLWRRSSSLPVFFSAKQLFLARLRQSQVPEDLVQFFDEKSNYVVPSPKISRHAKDRTVRTQWVVFDYHPCWSCGIVQQELAKFSRSSAHVQLVTSILPELADAPLRVAWRIRQKPFFLRLVKWH